MAGGWYVTSSDKAIRRKDKTGPGVSCLQPGILIYSRLLQCLLAWSLLRRRSYSNRDDKAQKPVCGVYQLKNTLQYKIFPDGRLSRIRHSIPGRHDERAVAGGGCLLRHGNHCCLSPD